MPEMVCLKRENIFFYSYIAPTTGCDWAFGTEPYISAELATVKPVKVKGSNRKVTL